MRCLFSNDFEGNFNGNFLVEINDSFVVADFLDSFLDDNVTTVNVVAEFFESFGDLDSVDRTVDSTGSAGLSTDGESNAFESCSNSNGVSLDLLELVSALTLVFSEHFKSRGSSDNSFTLGNEVVATVTVLNFNNVVLVSKALNVFFEYDLNCKSVGFKVISLGRQRR